MNKTVSTISVLVLLLVLFFAVTLASNSLLRGYGVDLTEDKIYSVTPGTESILSELETPVELNYFFSDTTSKSMPALRNYAAQVESLLKKYSELAGQNINLNIIDPQPFSVQEDKAAGFGLTAAAVGPAQDSVYFGLAGTNANGDAMIIGFFDPSKAAFLEYDISRLIYQLSKPEPINLSIVTDIAMMGEQNPLTGEVTQPFVVYQQLSELLNVTLVANSDDGIPENTDVLMVAHPQGLGRQMLYAIDQYLMQNGKAIFLVDPHFESDVMAMMGSVGANSSDVTLLNAYSVNVGINEVVLDSQAGLEVRSADGGAVRHFGFLGLGSAEINLDDVSTADLNTVNGASFANISLANDSGLTLEALLQSSSNSSLIGTAEYAAIPEPKLLANGFESDNTRKVLAARLTGSATSFFKLDDPETKEGFLARTENLNIVVIGDVDFLTDRFWVQQSNFFGQAMYSPFANNGDLIINLVENYGGAQALIGLRGRAAFSRPFERVAEIAVTAEAKFREQESRLQEQLQQTEAQLAQLQSQQADAISVSAEQQQTIDAFIAKRIETRSALRDVQFQLQKDINALGNQLKLINIIIAPIVLTVLLFIGARLMKRRI
ncbi:GldG family protein [Glaciecola sp. SC05]|uniref:GldG family protein n=1 Tax=Glaciecola sp. SC05 TaxID=1987355 RepID=UPI003528F609